MKNEIQAIVDKQRAFFNTGATRSVSARVILLDRMYTSVKKHEEEILQALTADLGKSAAEGYMTEVGMVLSDLRHTMRHVRKWAQPQPVGTEIFNFPGRSRIYSEPYGVTLVMGTWNYPFLLSLQPMIAAISAGNTCIVKPSVFSSATGAVIRKVISDSCPEEWVAVVEGGRDVGEALLDTRFDYIFFTGGEVLGRHVMEKAAKYLTPVTLELGGKSPVVIDDSADLKVAARRIAHGKFLNCGQTCIAPDYVLIDKRVEGEFVKYLIADIEEMYGKAPMESPDYGHIINDKHFNRLLGLMDGEKVWYGGGYDRQRRKIAPTILRNVAAEDAVMQEEIFGPILPIIPVETMIEAEDFITAREKPLALYLFTKRKPVEKRFLQYVSFGGGCVNDTIMHITGSRLPFGGVGNSGMGQYHGKYGFDTFSHKKSVLKKATFPDIPVRYPPFGGLTAKLVRLFLR